MHKNIRLLTWFNFFLDFRPQSAIAIIYFSTITGSFVLGLTIFSIERISQAIFEVPTGILSDMIGRKNTIVLGTICSIFAILFYAIANPILFLIIGAILEGIAQSFFSGNNQALLYDSLNEKSATNYFAEFLGKTNSMFQLALGISALIGGFIANYSLSLVMWISIVPQIICFFISLQIIEPQIITKKNSPNILIHLKEASQKFKINKKLRTLSLVTILDYGIGETMHQFRPAFILSLWPIWAVGIARSLSNFFAVIGFVYSGKIIKKFNSFKILIVGKLLNRLIALTAYIFPTIISPILLSLTSFIFAFRTVAGDTLLHKEFSDNQRATMGSLNALFGNIFFAIFAILLGSFADSIGPTKALIAGELLLFITIFLYYRLFRTP